MMTHATVCIIVKELRWQGDFVIADFFARLPESLILSLHPGFRDVDRLIVYFQGIQYEQGSLLPLFDLMNGQ